MKWHANPALVLGALSLLAACGDMARLTVAEGSGQSPVLPPPRTSLLPTVQIAPAVGWSPGATPVPAAGLAVQAFATGLAHPRWAGDLVQDYLTRSFGTDSTARLCRRHVRRPA